MVHGLDSTWRQENVSVQNSYQVSVHIIISRRADEDGFLHEANKAPKCIRLILYFSKNRSEQI